MAAGRQETNNSLKTRPKKIKMHKKIILIRVSDFEIVHFSGV
jgi:hypothetical protein